MQTPDQATASLLPQTPIDVNHIYFQGAVIDLIRVLDGLRFPNFTIDALARSPEQALDNAQCYWSEVVRTLHTAGENVPPKFKKATSTQQLVQTTLQSIAHHHYAPKAGIFLETGRSIIFQYLTATTNGPQFHLIHEWLQPILLTLVSDSRLLAISPDFTDAIDYRNQQAIRSPISARIFVNQRVSLALDTHVGVATSIPNLSLGSALGEEFASVLGTLNRLRASGTDHQYEAYFYKAFTQSLSNLTRREELVSHDNRFHQWYSNSLTSIKNRLQTGYVEHESLTVSGGGYFTGYLKQYAAVVRNPERYPDNYLEDLRVEHITILQRISKLRDATRLGKFMSEGAQQIITELNVLMATEEGTRDISNRFFALLIQLIDREGIMVKALQEKEGTADASKADSTYDRLLRSVVQMFMQQSSMQEVRDIPVPAVVDSEPDSKIANAAALKLKGERTVAIVEQIKKFNGLFGSFLSNASEHKTVAQAALAQQLYVSMHQSALTTHRPLYEQILLTQDMYTNVVYALDWVVSAIKRGEVDYTLIVDLFGQLHLLDLGGVGRISELFMNGGEALKARAGTRHKVRGRRARAAAEMNDPKTGSSLRAAIAGAEIVPNLSIETPAFITEFLQRIMPTSDLQRLTKAIDVMAGCGTKDGAIPLIADAAQVFLTGKSSPETKKGLAQLTTNINKAADFLYELVVGDTQLIDLRNSVASAWAIGLGTALLTRENGTTESVKDPWRKKLIAKIVHYLIDYANNGLKNGEVIGDTKQMIIYMLQTTIQRWHEADQKAFLDELLRQSGIYPELNSVMREVVFKLTRTPITFGVVSPELSEHALDFSVRALRDYFSAFPGGRAGKHSVIADALTEGNGQPGDMAKLAKLVEEEPEAAVRLIKDFFRDRKFIEDGGKSLLGIIGFFRWLKTDVSAEKAREFELRVHDALQHDLTRLAVELMPDNLRSPIPAHADTVNLLNTSYTAALQSMREVMALTSHLNEGLNLAGEIPGLVDDLRTKVEDAYKKTQAETKQLLTEDYGLEVYEAKLKELEKDATEQVDTNALKQIRSLLKVIRGQSPIKIKNAIELKEAVSGITKSGEDTHSVLAAYVRLRAEASGVSPDAGMLAALLERDSVPMKVAIKAIEEANLEKDAAVREGMVLAVMQDLASAVTSRAEVRSQYSAAQAQIALDQIAHLTALIEIKKQAEDLDQLGLGAQLAEHKAQLEHVISTRQQLIESEQAAQTSLIARYNQGIRSLATNVEQALQDIAQSGNERMSAITEWMRIHQQVLKPLVDGFNKVFDNAEYGRGIRLDPLNSDVLFQAVQEGSVGQMLTQIADGQVAAQPAKMAIVTPM